MPPRKRKSEVVDEDTDEEIVEKPVGQSSKRGRIINPFETMMAKSESKLKFDLEWNEFGEESDKNVKPLYYLYSKKLTGTDKVAAFDIDSTIIVTKSGKTFAQNNKDWKWFNKCVPDKLKELDKEGYRVTFITNQGGIEKGRTPFSDLRVKFQDIVSQLDIPVYIFISSGIK
jgi:bifunctional polynucleotide phosphatase/kinase